MGMSEEVREELVEVLPKATVAGNAVVTKPGKLDDEGE